MRVATAASTDPLTDTTSLGRKSTLKGNLIKAARQEKREVARYAHNYM